MAVQARFYVAEINQFATSVSEAHRNGWAAPAPFGKVVLRPVTRGELNKEWASATPSGEVQLTVSGGAFPWFQERLGKDIAITFDDRPADEV